MAQYQVGGSVYEVPDNISQQDLDDVLRQLAEQEDQKQQQPQAQQQQPLQAPTAPPPPDNRDNAFEYSVDQAQKLGGYAAQTVGNAIGNQGIADWGKDVVSQQDKDIAEGGYQSSLGDMSFLDAWEKGKTLDWIMTRGAENSATMVATPAVALTGFIAATLGAPVTATVLGGGALATGIGLGIGSATSEAKEKGLDINDQSTAQKNIAIGAVVGLLDRIGAGSIVGKAIPKEKLLTMSTQEIAEVLAKQDKGMARRFLTAVLKSGGGEAATEGAQSATEMAGVALQGGKYTKEEVINKLVDEMALGGAGGVAMKAAAVPVQGAAGALSNKPALPEDAEAASSFAADIEARAEEEGYDLNDLNKTSNKGARQVIDDLHADYDEQMKMQRQILKDALNIKDTDPLLARIEKTLAKLAYREARNKTKSVVGKRELEAVGNLVDPVTGQRLADTKEGADLINLMRKTNELTKLHNKGYQGGVSAITDQLSPFGSNIGYDRGAIAAERVLRPILSGGAAISSGGLSLAGQLAAQGTGRVIDKLTGRRSNVAKYIRDNKKRDPLIGVDEPSVLEQQQAKEQQRQDNETARRQAAFAAGDMPAKDSPEAVMTIATEGVDRDTLMQLMETIKQQRPDLAQAADEWLASVRGDPVKDIEGLTELIRAAKSIVDSDPNLSALKNPQLAARLSENYTIPVGAAGISAAAPRDVSAGYVRGIQDNRETAKQLADAVRGDGNLSLRDRALLLQVLQEYQANLGVDPAGRAQSLYDSARSSMNDKAAADKYLMPYVERVMQQQPQASNMAVPEQGSGQGVFPVPPKLTEKVTGAFNPLGDYRAMPQNESVTDNTYAGGRIFIQDGGFGGMNVDPEPAPLPDKNTGYRFQSNLYKKFNVTEKGNRLPLWRWLEQPKGNKRTEADAESLVAYVTRDPAAGKTRHYYTTDLQLDVPTQLARDNSNIKAGNQPFLRPTGYGVPEFGKQIGTIITSGGHEHPVYESIKVSPKPTIVASSSKSAMLAVPAGETLSNDFSLTTGGQYQLLPFLRTATNSFYDHKRKILASSNIGNIDQQLANLDQLLADHPNTLESKEAFADFLADAMGNANKDGSVPLIPYRALEMAQNPQIIVDQIGGLTEGQKDMAADGFAAADDFRSAYESGQARPDITGKLLLWGVLSKGVSPFVQEGAFLDVVTSRGNKTGIGKFIQDAADGNFNLKEYLQWTEKAIPTSSAGSGAKHNLNGFGKTTLTKMSKPMANGKTPMQHLHDLIADPELSGRDVRREFHRINDKVGINNKVLSFMLLVAGRNDVMVLDRVQFRNMFDDGRFEGFNLYDTTKVDKKQITGSGIQALGDDAMGLMYYEALERDLMPVVKKAYEDLGRGDDFSMGRYHWESWVASSAQEVDHGTINGIINESLGIENPYQNIHTREGKYDNFESGAVYYYSDGMPYIALPDGLGNMYEFTPEQSKLVLKKIKDNVIVPKSFKVSKNKSRPWYENPEVNKEALAELYRSEGGRPFDGGFHTSSKDYTDGTGSDVTGGSSGDRQVDPSDSNASMASSKGFFQSLADSFGSRPATPEEVRELGLSSEQDQQAQIVADYLSKGKPIPIGQKGTPFENGVQNPEAIKKIAEALGVAVKIYLSTSDMQKQQLVDHGVKLDGSTVGNLLATFDPRYSLSADSWGEIGVLKDGAKTPYLVSGKVSLQNYIFTLAHELGHVFGARPALNVRNKDGKPNKNWDKIVRISDDRNDASGKKVLKGAKPQYAYTLDGQLAFLIDAASKKPKLTETKSLNSAAVAQARQLIEELKQLQSKQGALSPYGLEDPSFSVRESYQVFQNSQAELAETGGYAAAVMMPKEAKSFEKFERTYMNAPEELIADLIAAYLTNPQRLKQIAPTAAQFARDLLNQSDSSAVAKFYSAPIGVVVAAIIANMLVGEREDEDEKAALSLGRGALSA